MALPDDLLQPIPGANPAGANLRYDPVYDKLKEARREEEDVDQGDWKRARKVADWPQVTKLATDALTKQSKDLQIAAWLTEALLRQQGLAGLNNGLAVLRGLMERFWDGLYPEIEDGDSELRAAPLAWVGHYLETPVKSVAVDKAGHTLFAYRESRTMPLEADVQGDEKKLADRQAAIQDGKLTPEEFDKAFAATPKAWYKQLRSELQAATATLQALDELSQEKFGDDAPSFIKLSDALEEVRHVAGQLLDKKLETDPDPPDAGPVESLSGTGAAGAPGGGGLTPEPTSVDDAAARIAGAARFLRHADPRNPAPYLLLRGFRWGELRTRGSALDPKLLAAPPTPVRTHLKGLLLDGKWAELLDAGEGVMATPNGRGWLDLQRYELTACEALGDEYQWVAEALRNALVGLLRDLPELPDLTLMDDTPTANAETRGWLHDAGLLTAAQQAVEEEKPKRGRAAAAAPPRPGRAAFERAMDEVRAGRPQKGIELLMREADQEKSSRSRFLRRSEAAGLMIEAGLDPVALPILNELLQQIEAHRLEEWEAPELVARPMGYLYRALQKLGDEAGVKDDLYRRICRLDPVQAIAFPSGSAGTDVPAGG
jgi:type VI secretion system protein ImpA